MKIKGIGPFLIVLAVLGLILYASTFTVDETEVGLVTRFNRIVRPENTPGLHFKVPIIEKIFKYKKNLQNWDGEKGEIQTLEKTYIYVDTFARWKIVDPELFFKTVANNINAQERLNEIINASVRDMITDYNLIETVRTTNREFVITDEYLDDIKKQDNTVFSIEYGRGEITRRIWERAHPQILKLGIELVDVKLKRTNYIESVRKSVYDRMIAERNQIAQKFRSEGKGEAERIAGQKEKELKQIMSDAYRTSQEVKGNADAEATRLFAEVISLDPEFYSFVKTLEIYNESLDSKSSLILSTDSEFFKYFKGYLDEE